MNTASLDDVANDLHTHFVRRAENFRKLANSLKWVALFASVIATLAQFVQGDVNGWGGAQILGICASGAILLASGALLIGERDTSSQLETARQAVDAARTAQEEVRAQRLTAAAEAAKSEANQIEFDVEFERAKNSLLASTAMIELIEISASNSVWTEEQLIDKLLKTTQQQLTVALGFNVKDDYSICIYKAHPSDDDDVLSKLVCLAQHRATNCDLTSARPFKEGQGIVGTCYSNMREMILPDLQSEGIAALFEQAASEREVDDPSLSRGKYRSMAAFPIMVFPDAKPWGVATATTDRLGHFTGVGEAAIKPHAALSLIADTVALAVATVRARDRYADGALVVKQGDAI